MFQDGSGKEPTYSPLTESPMSPNRRTCKADGRRSQHETGNRTTRRPVHVQRPQTHTSARAKLYLSIHGPTNDRLNDTHRHYNAAADRPEAKAIVRKRQQSTHGHLCRQRSLCRRQTGCGVLAGWASFREMRRPNTPAD